MEPAKEPSFTNSKLKTHLTMREWGMLSIGGALGLIALYGLLFGSNLTQAQQDALTLLDVKAQYEQEFVHYTAVKMEEAASVQKLNDYHTQADELRTKLGF